MFVMFMVIGYSMNMNLSLNVSWSLNLT